ncbi:MAG: hypothetical protein DMD73_14865 [Gemmatimonadetes bacterium]|nr:MAG: hypothetical protein DMD73_14865 [Gemmatimonadota bacterium]
MSLTVCLAPANTVGYPQGGGHLWVYLNWALALRAAGCRVIWLEGVDDDVGDTSVAHRRRWRGRDVRECVATLQAHLGRYGFANALALYSITGAPLPADLAASGLTLEVAADADLLLNLSHALPESAVRRFRRSAFVDTDPGLFQVWMTTGDICVAPHDVYFTIGETVGTPAARFPDCGLRWHYTPPPVFLAEWPVVRADPASPYTTITHWWGGTFEFAGTTFSNEKRVAYLEYADLPSRTPARIELSVCLGQQYAEWHQRLGALGWGVREAWEVSATPEQYRAYIQASRGEFSCVKPYCVQFANSWTSDRTICYLASGKPAVVQHTGPSRLPDAAGLFRFRSMDEAVRALAAIEADYERHCRLARNLAEEHFDGCRVVTRVLERALT